MYSSHIAIIDSISISDATQYFIGGIEERVCVNIMAWFDPFGFEYSPQSLGYIQVWRVWREVENIESTRFPFVNRFLHKSTCMIAIVCPFISAKAILHTFLKMFQNLPLDSTLEEMDIRLSLRLLNCSIVDHR